MARTRFWAQGMSVKVAMSKEGGASKFWAPPMYSHWVETAVPSDNSIRISLRQEPMPSRAVASLRISQPCTYSPGVVVV